MTNIQAWPHLSTHGVIRSRAKVLARAHREMRTSLVKQRLASGMRQKDVAEILNVSQQRVSVIERYDTDITLETLRSYANAVGALIDIKVEPDNNRSLEDSQGTPWTEIPLFVPTPSPASKRKTVRDGDWSDTVQVAADSKRTHFSLAA